MWQIVSFLLFSRPFYQEIAMTEDSQEPTPEQLDELLLSVLLLEVIKPPDSDACTECPITNCRFNFFNDLASEQEVFMGPCPENIDPVNE